MTQLRLTASHLVRSLLLLFVLALVSTTHPAAHGQKFEVLFSDNQGWTPRAKLLRGSDGNFYGTTYAGGVNNLGTVFRTTPDGAIATLASFNGSNGANPSSALVEGSDGNFYGMTARGGGRSQGTAFRMTPGGVLTTLVTFSGLDGSIPDGALLENSDGSFYGTTFGGGANNRGTVFKMTPDGVLTTLASFDSTTGENPSGGVVKGGDGNFYGTTSNGGASRHGNVFKMSPTGVLTPLASFNVANGTGSGSTLLKASDGNLYGTTFLGGESNNGTAFRLTASGEITTLASFSFYNGKPLGLLEGNDGNFYGATADGGAGGRGTVFKMSPAGALTTLPVFDYGGSSGSQPSAGLVSSGDGDFYGITETGGASSYGTIFKVTPSGTLTTVVSFHSSDVGRFPAASLMEGSSGEFFGTTKEGGTIDQGTIFKVTSSGTMTTALSFNNRNGSNPRSELLKGSDGNYYGTTYAGGVKNQGSVFKMTPAGVVATLVSFGSKADDGTNPSTGLVESADGSFYGTTDSGGTYAYGTVFRVTPAGVLTTVHSFSPSEIGGFSRLVAGSDGNFYGTMSYGGEFRTGSVFKVTASGAFTTVASFKTGVARSPYGGVVEGNDGCFYGTTYYGGANGLGSIFKVESSGEPTTLASFKGTNGAAPLARLVKGNDGNFYGTTSEGGASRGPTQAHGFGTLFRVTPSGELTTLYSFDGVIAGRPEAAPVFGSDGNLYGTAGEMVIWRLAVPMRPSVAITPPSAVTTTSAALSGSVNANGADATVTFEYGLTTAYGSSITPTPSAVTGSTDTAVSATLSGLTPHATYYYRLTSSNLNGSANAVVGSFTTLNSVPVAVNDSFVPSASDSGPLSLAVLGNDSDADGDPLTITAVTQGSLGSVTTDGTTLTYTPGPGFVGRDAFSYTVSDGIATATAQVELRATDLFTRVVLSEGSTVPGAGKPDSGIPAGTTFKSFGIPAINSTGRVALTAGYGSEVSIFGVEVEKQNSLMYAQRGKPAPGTTGALFSFFKDPMLNEAGDIAFLATLSGGDTTKLNKDGIWVISSSADIGAGAQLVARTGMQPPGTPAGARWKKFTNASFCDGQTQSAADGDNWVLAFTAIMTAGPGGVKAGNDMGLWLANPTGTVLALREGQILQIGETEKKIRTFASLMPMASAAGQGNGVVRGTVAVQAFFTDGSQALLGVSGPNGVEAVAIAVLALSGDPVAGDGGTVAKFGIPSQSITGAVTAWIGSLKAKGNPVAVFERSPSKSELVKLLAQKTDAAPEIGGATFSAFKSVAVSDSGDALILGKVSGKGMTSASDEGLWWQREQIDRTVVQLLAREGAQPPGVPEGARWSTFTSIALAEAPYGPLFTATLQTGPKGKAGPGGISSSDDQGLWAVDSSGMLRLIAQEGHPLQVDGSTTPKILKSFNVLSAVPGSTVQRRSFADQGQIIFQAAFTDGSEAVVRAQLP